jgi:hypothetical protein
MADFSLVLAKRIGPLFLVPLLCTFGTPLYGRGITVPTGDDTTSTILPGSKGISRSISLVKEKYQGDTLTVGNYLIAYARTGTDVRGIRQLALNEDSVLAEIAHGMGRLGLKLGPPPAKANILDPGIVLVDRKNWSKRVETNVLEHVAKTTPLKGKLNLIPTIIYRVDYTVGFFYGPGPVNVSYFITLVVFIFNDKKELVYRDGSVIRARSKAIPEWEDALAFPIQKRVTRGDFEEMIRLAMLKYVE